MKVQSTLWLPKLDFSEKEAIAQLTAADPQPQTPSLCSQELLAQLPALAGMEEFHP
jgi:hypothetical protein